MGELDSGEMGVYSKHVHHVVYRAITNIERNKSDCITVRSCIKAFVSCIQNFALFCMQLTNSSVYAQSVD